VSVSAVRIWRQALLRLLQTVALKPLRSKVELVVRQSPASKDVNMEAEEATSLEADIRQPVKTQQTE
jgi:hypothetical protein